MKQQTNDLLDLPRSALPPRIPHLVNRHLEDNEADYSYSTQRYLVQAIVGDGLTYWYYTTMQSTPEQVTTNFERDLSCLSAKVVAIALEYEECF